MDYAAAWRELHDFFILAGTGAAALVGLLFVGLSLHLRAVISATEIRGLARVTLANFGAVLFVSMFLVIDENRVTAGWQVLGSGLATIVFTAPSLRSGLQRPELIDKMSRRDRFRFFLRFGLSLIGYLGIVIAGVLLLASRVLAFTIVMEVALVLLMVIALRNTWDLLVTVGEVIAEGDRTV